MTEAHPGKTGSWVAVFLIIAAFTIGALGMIFTNVVIAIVAGVVLVLGIALALLSRIFEQVE